MTSRYTSPTGNDTTGDGSLGNPYATVVKALSVSSAGDIVEMMAGTYIRNDKPSITADGALGNPIIVRNYLGGAVYLSGAIPSFPANEWVQNGSPATVYKTQHAYVNTGNDAIGAWDAAREVGLYNYAKENNLRATNHVYAFDGANHTAPIYQGPGVWRDGSNFWYCRLDQSTDSLTLEDGSAIANAFPSGNPNTEAIVPFYTNILYILSGATYITFQGITFRDCDVCVQLKSTTHDIVFSGCTFNFRGNAITQNDSTNSDITITQCIFNGGWPIGGAWTDVKDSLLDVDLAAASEAYPEFQSTCIGGLLDGWTIGGLGDGLWHGECYGNGNVFRDTFDAISLGSGSIDTTISYNTLYRIMDDCIDVKAYAANIEIGYNLLLGTSGISVLTDASGLGFTVGDVYAHHNVIYVPHRRTTRVGDTVSGYNRWDCAGPIGSHGTDPKDDVHLKFYNNTVIARASKNASGGTMLGNFTASSELFFYNNILWSQDDRQLARYHTIAAAGKVNGNFWGRLAQTTNFATEYAEPATYATWAAFQTAMGLLSAGSRWEINGDYGDPGFNTASIAGVIRGIDTSTVWSLFRPTNLECYASGSTEAPAWPGFTNRYRGALQQFTATYTSQPAESAQVDTYVREGAPTSGSATDTVISTNPTAGSRRFAMMRWDLSSIPAGSAIMAATLYLYSVTNAPASDRVHAVHLVLAANSLWVETATWNAPASGLFWAGDPGHDGGTDGGASVAGTDYQTVASGTFTFLSGAAAGTEKTVALSTDDVATKAGGNLDLLIRRTDAVSSTFDMHSSNSATANLRPKLVIDYIAPLAVAAAGEGSASRQLLYFLAAKKRRRAAYA